MQLSLLEPNHLPEPIVASADDPHVGFHGLRYYQRQAIESVEAQLAQVRSTLVVMATGTGKTETYCGLARRTQGRVLVLAHRDELVRDGQRRLKLATGERVDVEKADEFASLSTRIVVASVQTMSEQRLKRWPKDHFQLVIPDECHHYVSPTYKRVLDWFETAKIVGVTATPDRSDEKAMGLVFNEVAYLFDILQGIEAGYLVPIRGIQVELSEIDLEDVGKTAGDLAAGELDEKMVKAARGIVRKTLELGEGRQGVAFMPGVAGAEYLAHCFNEELPGSAAFVSGETDPVERAEIMQDFREGKYRYLCNCQIATEGFDAPGVSLIIQGRPTLSRSLYAQMIGRGTRVLRGTVDHIHGEEGAAERRAAIAASPKKDMLILDFVGNSGKHSLITPEDLLGGNYSEEEVAKAKEIAKKEPGETPEENLKKARTWLRELAQRQRVRKVAAVSRPFDPFETLGMEQFSKDAIMARFKGTPATPAQIEALRKAKVPETDLRDMSKRAATALLDDMAKRRKEGLASYAQLRQLRKHGITDPTITSKQANSAMGWLQARGWGKRGVDPKELWAVVYGGDK